MPQTVIKIFPETEDSEEIKKLLFAIIDLAESMGQTVLAGVSEEEVGDEQEE